MPAMPRISTIIATHERPQLLCEALDSLQAQHLRPQEVIVVDDGSGPATAAALRQWQARTGGALALRCLRQRNSGPAVARNRGIAASRGDFLHFMDDDDLLAPLALQQLADAQAGAPRAAVSMASHALLYGAALPPAQAPLLAPVGGSAAQVLAAMIAGTWFVPIHGYLFSRAAVARMGAWNPVLHSQEDDEYLLRSALGGVAFLPAPAAAVYYRQHDGVRRATPGKPGESVQQGLRHRLHDDLAIREQVFLVLRAQGRLTRYRAAFLAWWRRLAQRYAPLLGEVRTGEWALLAWLQHETRAGAIRTVAREGRHTGVPFTVQR